MSDLIERQAAMKPLRDDWQASESRGDIERAEIAKCHYIEISNLPAAQPEIIRCRDCENYQTDWKPTVCGDRHYCAVMDSVMPPDGFCNYAERREATQ